MGVLTFLGTGCGWPMADRFHSSLLLEKEGRRWLIDAGEPCSHRLKALGVPVSSLDAVFISHGHSDHVSGLPMLIQGGWLEKRTRPLPIYLPAELIAPLKAWLETVYLPEKLIGFPIEYQAWEQLPGQAAALDDGRLRVSVNPTSHLNGLRMLIDPTAHDRFLAYSLAFDWPGPARRLVCSADLGQPQDLEALLTQPCDLLVCESSHFILRDLFVYLKDKPIRRICLTHPSLDVSHQAKEIRALGRELLPTLPAVNLMRDGQRVQF